MREENTRFQITFTDPTNLFGEPQRWQTLATDKSSALRKFLDSDAGYGVEVVSVRVYRKRVAS